MKTIIRMMCAALLMALAIQGAVFPAACAQEKNMTETTAAHFPQTGKKTKTDGRLTIDYSHMDQGYVMVRARKSDRRMQLGVKHGADSVFYEINGEGKYETIPLQYGNGEYRFSLTIARKKGSNRCESAGNITLKCSMEDESSCFLYPNQYVNYDADSPVVEKASELCRDLDEPMDKAQAICDYIEETYIYDFVKYGQIMTNDTKNMLPDIMAAWKTKMGVCQDLSALTCAMLRSQGIHAKLVIGSAKGTTRHAWVVYTIDGESRRFDPSFKTSNYKAELVF